MSSSVLYNLRSCLDSVTLGSTVYLADDAG
jgi:hypothetical protein